MDSDTELSCGFVFNKKPRMAKLYDWRYYTADRSFLVPTNISGTFTQYNVTSVSDTEEACELGNEHNPNKSLVATSNSTKVVCYYNAADSGDSWRFDYWADGTEEIFRETTEYDWYDLSSHLTIGTKDGRFYGYADHTFKASSIEKFKIDYIMNENEPVVDGKRKWEMWCWQGSLDSPEFIIKLDPWSTDVGDYEFYDTGDKTNNGTAAEWGQSLTDKGWTNPNPNGYLNMTYVGDGYVVGNTSFFYNASYEKESRQDASLGSAKNDVTCQAAYYDEGNDSIFASFVLYLGGTTKVYAGVHTTQNTTHYWFQDVGDTYHNYFPLVRSNGWHNFTMYVGSNFVDCFIEGVAYLNLSQTITIDKIEFQLQKNSSYWDEVLCWNGTPADRPTAPDNAPTISYVQFNQSSYSSDEDITASALVNDVDLDSLTVNFTWTNITHQLYVESFTNQADGTIVNATLGSANTTSHYTINVSVWVSDGTNTAEDHNSTVIYANEAEGDTAIDTGIASSTAASGTNSTEQQVVILNSTGGQTFGTFDRVLAYNNTRWLFLYQTGNENLTDQADIEPALYVWENVSLTAAEITDQVSGFINGTDT